MSQSKNILISLGLTIALAACSGTGTKQVDQDQDQHFGAQQGGDTKTNAIGQKTDLLATRVIYFDFDSSDIKSDSRDIIAAHAAHLSATPSTKIVLEGHADERGSREYNLALGERRAKAVQQLMVLQGVNAQQIQVISFGEERPVALGHDEAAWHLNRRVEILYSGK